MRILVLGEPSATVEKIAGWLGDDGHIVRRRPNVADGSHLPQGESFDAIVSATPLSDTESKTIAGHYRDAALTVPLLIAIDAEGSGRKETGDDVRWLNTPLRRRVLMSALRG